MNFKNIKLSLLAVALISTIGISSLNGLGNIKEEVSNKHENEINLIENINNHHLSIKKAAGSYYDTIGTSSNGTNLLNQLRTLNNQKRIREVGYDDFADYYYRTDGDPSIPGNLICFYSGTSEHFSGSFTTGNTINCEHVWPDSRGGNSVEDDIHMARPTLVAENGSRGNSFYVEGKKHQSQGWDPVMESFGLAKYRGDAARIIFYCVVASDRLSLVDLETDSANNKTMGKLSDLLKWNLLYPVEQTEIRRNEAIAQSDVQGNRNPFIDHPEYACKIWGNTNTATKAVCDTYAAPSVTLDKTTASVNIGSTTTITAEVRNSTSNVSWSSNKTTVATVNSSGVVSGVSKGTATITASITVNSVQYTATCLVTVKDPSDVSVSLGTYTITPNTDSYLAAGSWGANNLNINKSDSSLDDLTFSNINNVRLNSSPNADYTITIGGNATSGGEFTIGLPYGMIATAITFSGLLVDSGKTPTLKINNGVSFTHSASKTSQTLYPYANSLHISTIGTSRIWTSSIEIKAAINVAIAAESFGTLFLDKTNAECTSKNVKASTWNSMKVIYDNADSNVATLIRNAEPNISGTDLEHAIARYLVIANKYKYEDFIGIANTSRIKNILFQTNEDITLLAIVIISFSALIGTIFIFKRKRNKDNK